MRTILRATLLATLIFWHASPVPAAEPLPEVDAPIVRCESAPAPDTGDVQIGTALLLTRGGDVAEAVASCDGTVSVG